MEEKKIEEKKKGTTNKTAIIIACICGGVFFLFIICMFVLPLLLVTYSAKKVAPDIKNKAQEIIDKAEEEIEKYEQEEKDDEITCSNYSPKTISSRVFNDTYYKNNECSKYTISDLNIELVDKKIDSQEDYFVHTFDISINGHVINEKLVPGARIQLSKFNDYIAIESSALGSGIMQIYVFDKDGNLAYNIPTADSKGCQYILVKSDGELVVRQDYGLEDYPFASSTCDVSKLSKPFSEYCTGNNNHLNIYKKLEEVNGKLELVEQNNFECDSTY